MKTLRIEDLSKSDEMDRTAMTHLSGGRLPLVIANYIQSVDNSTHGGQGGQGGQNDPQTMFQHVLEQLTQQQG